MMGKLAFFHPACGVTWKAIRISGSVPSLRLLWLLWLLHLSMELLGPGSHWEVLLLLVGIWTCI